MKTRTFFLLAILVIAFGLVSCKQVAGGDYYPSGSECYFQRLNFYSSQKVLAYFGGSGGTYDVNFVQEGNKITFTCYTTVFTFHFDGAGCLVPEGSTTCKYCEQ